MPSVPGIISLCNLHYPLWATHYVLFMRSFQPRVLFQFHRGMVYVLYIDLIFSAFYVSPFCKFVYSRLYADSVTDLLVVESACKF
jgi:hypothetical protein